MSGLPVMFECPREFEVYDVKLQRCKFECRESGRFPYPGDNKKYYECVYVTPFKVSEHDCTDRIILLLINVVLFIFRVFFLVGIVRAAVSIAAYI